MDVKKRICVFHSVGKYMKRIPELLENPFSTQQGYLDYFCNRGDHIFAIVLLQI